MVAARRRGRVVAETGRKSQEEEMVGRIDATGHEVEAEAGAGNALRTSDDDEAAVAVAVLAGEALHPQSRVTAEASSMGQRSRDHLREEGSDRWIEGLKGGKATRKQAACVT